MGKEEIDGNQKERKKEQTIGQSTEGAAMETKGDMWHTVTCSW